MQSTDTPLVTAEIDWADHLEQQNPTWHALPRRWLEAPFLGNGMMGTMVFQTGERAVRFQVGRSDVHDHRPLDLGGTMFTRNRLPIGYFELKAEGKITGGSMELDLYNAEATGIIETEAGRIRWRSFVPSDHMAIVHQIEPDAGEAGCVFQWHAEPAISPRQVFRENNFQDRYENNPDPIESTRGEVSLCTQPLRHGGGGAKGVREGPKGPKVSEVSGT